MLIGSLPKKRVSIIDRLRYLLHIAQAPKFVQCFKVFLRIFILPINVITVLCTCQVFLPAYQFCLSRYIRSSASWNSAVRLSPGCSVDKVEPMA